MWRTDFPSGRTSRLGKPIMLFLDGASEMMADMAVREENIVLLVIEPWATRDAIRLAQSIGCAIWCGSDTVTAEEHKELTTAGINITRFAFPLLGAESDVVEEALATVVEHHPTASIWVQSNRRGTIS